MSFIKKFFPCTHLIHSTFIISVTHPPRFVQQPAGEVAYKSGDQKAGRVELLCEAEADPAPTYVYTNRFTELTSITSRPLLIEIEALQIYTCADRCYVINCN